MTQATSLTDALLSFRTLVVRGHSMATTLRHGDRVLTDCRPRHLVDLRRGDVVAFCYPNSKGQVYVKRIVGLPREQILLASEGVVVDGHVLIEPYLKSTRLPEHYWGLEWEVGEKQFFVLGDYRSDSWDSRRFGPVHHNQLIGVVRIRYWPPWRWGLVPRGSTLATPSASGPPPWHDS